MDDSRPSRRFPIDQPHQTGHAHSNCIQYDGHMREQHDFSEKLLPVQRKTLAGQPCGYRDCAELSRERLMLIMPRFLTYASVAGHTNMHVLKIFPRATVVLQLPDKCVLAQQLIDIDGPLPDEIMIQAISTCRLRSQGIHERATHAPRMSRRAIPRQLDTPHCY